MALIFVVGATATGKSDLALDIAERINAHIINADSMQLYRGMDIGTAKVPPADRRGIPHHLMDVVDVRRDVSVAWYQETARKVIDETLASGRSAVVVGGTGLYVKSILDDLRFPDTDPVIRARLELEATQIGGDALHRRLAQLDPAAALAIPKENQRRVIRALEVIEITGEPFTANLPREGTSLSRYPEAKQFGLSTSRSGLDLRIEERVDRMWEMGLVEETRHLVELGLREGRTARAALGYAQILRFLDGEISEEQAREATKIATRQYARRQETWFKRDDRIHWISEGRDRLSEVLQSL